MSAETNTAPDKIVGPAGQEAPGVWWARFYDGVGQEHTWTLRQRTNETDVMFIDRTQRFQFHLSKNGYTPTRQQGKPESNQPPQAQSAPPAPASSENSNSFEVESIKLAAGGEHPRWVVKGGNFKKYGVTCWPETLEEAGIAGHMDPLKDNKPGGKWIAHYINKEEPDERGRLVPDKVIRLERIKD